MKGSPLWYKDAVIYELRVGAFHDANGDGVGDFEGLTQRLDYIQDLGVNTLWLLPFYPSPGKDDGYDIADYTNIHPSLGNLKDFKIFLKEAHKRNIRVITELVINHTSDEHAWFQRARRAPTGHPDRNFYVWSDKPTKYREARIIFRDFEPSNWSWDPVANQYYWHRFFAHQPDLNFENPAVQKAVTQVMDFWFDMGVDGMRLDAIPYIFEREGTNCENLPETHDYLKKLRSHLDRKYNDRMFLAEANQWPEDAVAYFGNGDECHMSFHFPVMPRLFMALHMEDRFPIIDIFEQTPPIPDNCQWAIFLRNHDELTLEMVTDEERDYMYRVYALDPQARVNLGIRRRLAPLLGGNRRRIELMNGLLFSLPGTPVIYYGDEIGMGDNIYLGDRNSVRTPMQWSGDKNAGFSRANPHKLYLPINLDPEYHYETTNVEAQQNNPHSLLWWMKRLISLRERYKAFGRGTIEFLNPSNPRVLTFIRRFEDEIILVVVNLSRFVQFVELNLADYKKMIPIELFGRIEFPSIGDLPYFITLGPHGFYWFELTSPEKNGMTLGDRKGGVPRLANVTAWDSLFAEKKWSTLEKALPVYLQGRRWFGNKANKIESADVREVIPMASGKSKAYYTIVQVSYGEGHPDHYSLPLTYATGDKSKWILDGNAAVLVLDRKKENEEESHPGVIYDALTDPLFCTVFLDAISRKKEIKGRMGKLVGKTTTYFKKLRGPLSDHLEPSNMKVEQSNTSIVYGDRLILKMFRRLESGLNPDFEICHFLTEKTDFKNIPLVAGYLEYQKIGQKDHATVGILQEYVPNSGDAWRYTVDEMSRFYERVMSQEWNKDHESYLKQDLMSLSLEEIPVAIGELIGPYFESARLLGQRTAELHLALGSSNESKDFAPEEFTPFVQRSLYQSVRNNALKGFDLLKKNMGSLKGDVKKEAQMILEKEKFVLSYIDAIRKGKISAVQIRIHGDYHLGQVLYTGKDFVIIDFEGEPRRSLSERKLKRSPLKDVAGLIRSFHYASYVALREQTNRGTITPERLPDQEKFSQLWMQFVSATYLRSYLETAGKADFIPKELDKLDLLLQVFLIEKAVYELGYELNNRPDWIMIPVRGMLQLLDSIKN